MPARAKVREHHREDRGCPQWLATGHSSRYVRWMAAALFSIVRGRARTYVSVPLAVLLLVAPPAAHAENISVSTGVYSDGLLLGFDPTTRIVSGYYHSETGEGQFSCIFFVVGKLSGSGSIISTYFPEDPASDLIKGKLLVDASQKLTLRLQSEHGGCGNVRHFADAADPAEFTLDSGHAWTAVAVVKSERAYFFATPESRTHRKAYIVKGDGVGVRARKPGWLEVEYIDPDGKSVSGWIREADVYRVA